MKDTIYKNKDFCLSAFLIAAGCKFLGCKKENNTTLYNFEDTESLQKLVSLFYIMTITVYPMSESSIIRSLKSVINAHNTQGTNNVRYSNI